MLYSRRLFFFSGGFSPYRDSLFSPSKEFLFRSLHFYSPARRGRLGATPLWLNCSLSSSFLFSSSERISFSLSPPGEFLWTVQRLTPHSMPPPFSCHRKSGAPSVSIKVSLLSRSDRDCTPSLLPLGFLEPALTSSFLPPPL